MIKGKNNPLGSGNGPLDPGVDPGGGPRVFSTSSTEFADAGIAINLPRVDFVGPSFRVEGTAFIRMHTLEFIKFGGEGKTTEFDTFVTEGFKVSIRIGDEDHEAHVSEQNDKLHWSHEVKDAASGELNITAELEGTVTESQSKTVGGETQHHTDNKSVQRTDSVSVTVDGEGPEVQEANLKNVTIGPPYRAIIEGKAEDQSGVNSVRWHLGSSSKRAENSSGNWSEWRAEIPLPDRTKPHTIRISARDKVGHRTSEAAKVTIPADEESPTVELIYPKQDPFITLFPEEGDVFTLPIMGTASDSKSKIETVRWRLDEGPVQEAENIKGDWSDWRIMAEFDSPGSYDITVWARDMAGNGSEDEPDVQLEVELQVLD
ncbi:hypothetical protein SAMN05443144_11062 [Fodinibius roseus]|uniref:Uncharacterized protein n=1 Tax=Fodinibius roseus TaxID=1194090 RepID=A0A1M5CRE0_9BACT|nr:hypothetical protein [Fodinibius roseus]SHF57196.1 hypothetical protein SAMN05443144_11062 [Fodinibius roseus]